jgi:hypothetical protein
VPLLLTAPRIGWVLAFGIAAEVGDIARFASDILGTTHTHFGAGRSVGLGQRAAPFVDGEPQSVAVAWVSVLRAHFAGRRPRPCVSTGRIGAGDRARARAWERLASGVRSLRPSEDWRKHSTLLVGRARRTGAARLLDR